MGLNWQSKDEMAVVYTNKTQDIRTVQPTRCNVSQFMSVRRSTCFRRVFRLSSEAQNCTCRPAAGINNGLTNTLRCMCGVINEQCTYKFELSWEISRAQKRQAFKS